MPFGATDLCLVTPFLRCFTTWREHRRGDSRCQKGRSLWGHQCSFPTFPVLSFQAVQELFFPAPWSPDVVAWLALAVVSGGGMCYFGGKHLSGSRETLQCTRSPCLTSRRNAVTAEVTPSHRMEEACSGLCTNKNNSSVALSVRGLKPSRQRCQAYSDRYKPQQ